MAEVLAKPVRVLQDCLGTPIVAMRLQPSQLALLMLAMCSFVVLFGYRAAVEREFA